MSQTTTPVVPIRPTAAVAPQSWPAGPYPACPPDAFSAMARLMSCYEDVRLATEFLSKVMTDIIENNPAVTEAIVEAIQKAGSSLPTIGVTDGSAAQPGQVGEWIQMEQTVSFTTTAGQTQQISMGVLQPGDWNVQGAVWCPTPITGVNFALNPYPAGFGNPLQAFNATVEGGEVLVSPVVRALISAPTLIPYTIITNTGGAGAAAGTLDAFFYARRAR